MAKYWEIRESYGDRRGGSYGEKSHEDYMNNPEMMEAYESGREEALTEVKELIEEMCKEKMGQRMGRRDDYGSRMEGMGERRGRDSMGRYR